MMRGLRDIFSKVESVRRVWQIMLAAFIFQ